MTARTQPRPRLRRRALALFLGAALSTLAVLPATAQQRANIVIRSVDVDDDGTTRVTVALPPDLQIDQFTTSLSVLENRTSVQIDDVAPVTVEATELNAAVALLIDVSGSTLDGDALTQAKQAARDFVTEVAGLGVPVTLVSFGTTPVLLVEASTNVAALNAAVEALVAEPDAETSLFDAVVLASQDLAGSGGDRQRSAVIFTDGADTVSLTDVRGAIEAAQAAGLSITSVALETDATDLEALTTFAEQTSGAVLSVDNAAGLSDALGRVATSITTQLVITYASQNTTDKDLTITVSAVSGGTAFSDRRTIANERRPNVEVQPPPRVVPRSATHLIEGGAALGLGLSAALVAVTVLGSMLLIRPAGARSAKVLKRQLSPPDKSSNVPKSDDIRLKERVAAVMDAVPKPSGYDARLQLQLDQASWPLRAGEFLALTIGLGTAGLLVGLLGARGNPVLGITFAGIGLMIPRLILMQRRQKRTQLFHEQLPDTLQMLAGSLRAGYGLMQGLENVSTEGQAPTATEFGRVMTETRLGIPLEDALAAMAERVGSEDFRWVTVAVSIQRKVGGNLAELLDTVATTLRERDQVRRQVKVLSAEGRLSAVILVALPIVFALYLASTKPDYLRPLFTTTPGQMMLVAAGVLMGVGIAWIRVVVRIDV